MITDPLAAKISTISAAITHRTTRPTSRWTEAKSFGETRRSSPASRRAMISGAMNQTIRAVVIVPGCTVT